jgi:hypothetical protein
MMRRGDLKQIIEYGTQELRKKWAEHKTQQMRLLG